MTQLAEHPSPDPRDTAEIESTVDVAVVGGGVAGLTAAIALSRFRRSVLVIDAGRPRNAVSPGAHNFLSRDGVDPRELLAVGREELASFGGVVRSDVAVGAARSGDRIELRLESGAVVRARRLIVASGTTDVLPEVGGLAGRWGRDVIHCPYCHGWEVRDQAIGVLATDQAVAVHQALMLAELSDDVRILTHTAEALSPEQCEVAAARGIDIVDGAVRELIVVDDRLTGVRLADGREESVQAVVVATGLHTASAVLDDLGVARDTAGLGGYLAEPTGLTSATGVYVAGNVTSPYATMILAAAEGMTVAGAVNADLIGERTERALPRARR